MKKYLLTSLLAGLVMFLVGGAYGMLETSILGADLYSDPMFLDIATFGTQILIGILLVKLAHAFLLAYLHERIPHCGSSLWTKTWRFTLLAFFLVYTVGLGMTWATMTVPTSLLISWAISGLLQTFFGSLVIISILYRFSDSRQS